MDDTLWNKCGQEYFEQLRRFNQASLLDIGLFDETIEIIRSFMTEVGVIPVQSMQCLLLLTPSLNIIIFLLHIFAILMFSFLSQT